MYLSQVRISGFKSFLEKTNIELQKSKITVIIGPNGCGKSNIFDAVRWAIGEASGKLRVDTGDNIIFAGSKNSAAVNLAQVHLHFINDEQLDIPKYGKMHEFQISRKLFRDGNNQYYINQRSCRLLDVKILLMDLGVSYSGYAFIEQGNVTQIVQSKPEEKRQIIEEAAGLMKFKTLKKETENKLNSTKQNLLRIEDKRLELQQQEEKLAKQANVVEEYLAIKGRADFLRKMILAVQWKKAHYELKDIMTNRENLENFAKEELVKIENDSILFAKQLLQKEQELQESQKNYQQISQEVHKLETQWQLDHKLFSQSHIWIEKLGEEKKNLQKQATQKKQEYEKFSTEESPKQMQYKDLEELQTQVIKLEKEYQIATSEIKILEKKEQELILEITKNESFLQWKDQTIENKNQTELESLKKKLKNQILKEQKNQQSHLQYKEKNKDCEQEILQLEKNIKDTLELQKNRQSKFVKLQTSHLQIKQSLSHQEQLFQETTPLKNVTFSPQETGFIGFIGDLLHLKKNAPRNDFHFLDNFLHTAVFISYKKLDSILEQLAQNQITDFQMIFLDDILPNHFPSSLEKELIFSPLISKEQIEKMSYFFRSLKNNSNLENKTQKKFAGFHIFCFLPHLFHYKKITQETLSEKYSQHRKKLTKFTSEQFQIEKSLQSLKQENHSLEKKAQELEKNLINRKKEKEQIQKIVDNQQKNYWQTQAECKQTEYQLQTLTQEILQNDLLQKKKEQTQKTLKDLEKTKIQVVEKIKFQSKIFVKLEQELEKEKKEYQEKKNEWQSYQLQKNFHKSTIFRLQKECNDYQNLLQEKEKSITSWQNKVENQEVLQKMENEIQNKKQLKQKKIAQLEECNQQFFILEKKNKSLQTQKNELQKQSQKFQEVYYENKIKINSLSERQKNFEEQLQDNYGTSAEEFLRIFPEKDFEINSAKKELEKLQKKMPFYANVNLGAKEEYKEVKKNLDFYNQQKKDLEESVFALCEAIDEIEKNSKNIFINTFEQINNKFQELFALVFQGGQANLVLQNEKDLLNSGVEIFAQPQGKKLQNLQVLSSGEKSLVGLVFIFAILVLQPNIFCFLDEVDAALDANNVGRIIAVIKEIAKNNQIIMVSHNQKTMLIGDLVLGVTMMDEGISRVFSVDIQKQTEQIQALIQ